MGFASACSKHVPVSFGRVPGLGVDLAVLGLIIVHVSKQASRKGPVYGIGVILPVIHGIAARDASAKLPVPLHVFTIKQGGTTVYMRSVAYISILCPKKCLDSLN